MPSFAQLSFALLCIASLLSNSIVQSQSALRFWSFCYHSENLAGQLPWSVTISGSLVTGQLFQKPNSLQVGYYEVKDISGIRTYVDSTGNSTQSFITGIQLPGTVISVNDRSFGATITNDNLVSTYWPVVSAVAFTLDRPVPIPVWNGQYGNGTMTQVMLHDGPPAEVGQDRSLVGISYFVFSEGNVLQTLQCPAPPAVKYSFLYTSTPALYMDKAWSSCVAGTLDLVGPYNYMDTFSGRSYNYWITTGVTGKRVWANATYVQVVNLTSISSGRGADFTLYDNQPAVVDKAGITFTTNPAPMFPGISRTDPNKSTITISSQNAMRIDEVGEGSWQSYADFQFAIYDPSTPLPVCPRELIAKRWDFCYVATGSDQTGRWAVVMKGFFVSNTAIGRIKDSFFVTMVDGTRNQFNQDGSYVSSSLSGMTDINGREKANDNRLYVNNPFTSEGGLALDLSPITNECSASQKVNNNCPARVQFPYGRAPGARAAIPPQRTTTIAGNPPREIYVEEAIYDYSSFFYQPGNVRNYSSPNPLDCNIPEQYHSEMKLFSNFSKSVFSVKPALKAIPFKYHALAVDPLVKHSSCVTGVMYAQGPFHTQNGLQSTHSWVLNRISGERTFIDDEGHVSITNITGLSGENSASNLLWNDVHFDWNGVAFTLNDGVTINLYSEYGYVHEYLSDASLPDSRVVFQYSEDPDFQYVCMQPGASVEVSQKVHTPIIGAILLIIGSLIAVSTVEQSYVQFRRRRSCQLLMWMILTSIVLGIGAIWAAQCAMTAGFEIECEDCLHMAPTSFAVRMGFIAMLPAFFAVFAGLLFMLFSLHRYENGRINRVRHVSLVPDSATNEAEPSMLASTLNSINTDNNSVLAEGAAMAMYSTTNVSDIINSGGRDKSLKASMKNMSVKIRAVKNRLRVAHSWHAYAAGLLLTVAICVTRGLVVMAVVTQATISVPDWANAVSAIVVWILSSASMLVYFYAPHFRWFSAVLVSGAAMIDMQIVLSAVTASYSPTQVHTYTSPLYLYLISAEDWLLIAGMFGCAALILLIAMHFFKIRASRRVLAAAMKRTKNKLNSAQSEIVALKSKATLANVQYSELERSLSALSLLRPLQGEDSVLGTRLLSFALLQGNVSSALHRTILMRSAAMVMPSLMTNKNGASRALSPTTRVSGSIAAWSSDPAATGNKTPSGTADETNEKIELDCLEPELLKAIMTGCQNLLLSDKPISWMSSWQGSASDTCVLPSGSPALTQLISSYRPSLGACLSHPITCELLKDALLSAACSENILFLCALARFKQLHGVAAERLAFAQLIAEHFIEEGAAHEININSTLRTSILASLTSTRTSKAKANSDLFSRAEREILMLIETNNWKSFVGSPQYLLCGQILARNTMIQIYVLAQQHETLRGTSEATNRDALLMASQTHSSQDIEASIASDPTDQLGPDGEDEAPSTSQTRQQSSGTPGILSPTRKISIQGHAPSVSNDESNEVQSVKNCEKE